MVTLSLGLPKYFLVKMPKLHRELGAKRWVYALCEHPLRILYPDTIAPKLAMDAKITNFNVVRYIQMALEIGK